MCRRLFGVSIFMQGYVRNTGLLFWFRNKIKVVTRSCPRSGETQGRGQYMNLDVADRKTYVSPTLRRLTTKQARLFLLGQATNDDQGAREVPQVFCTPPAHENPVPRDK
jgi:hypothetical protein